ncbi:hypothetical protein E0F15_06185 [Frankia sp. B2]|uniref:Uncharacterized protein n=1 Tax=Frankia casuarinae (strain DSM 45818 / CECT 9043 / HFP020203 / CcI3) TaxID=106370 RepID=Q2J649_FRACC|nr:MULTISPECIES: hypothetical protein [unclassified Frankia]ABD13243.1 hypothetical protein Francci3_3893 [Frankia casuarinae]TFE33079.1 hypothetical protein E0F15_06185 [Frankia sp. B2]
MARTLLYRADPDPIAAAASARDALDVLDVLDGRPTRGVIQRSGEMWREMHHRWPKIAAVQDLGEVIDHSRRALEAKPPASA